MNGHFFGFSLLALLIGIVAGMRAMTAPVAVSWAAQLGQLSLSGTWLAFLGYVWTAWVLTLFAAGELITDQLPSTPSRTVPVHREALPRGPADPPCDLALRHDELLPAQCVLSHETGVTAHDIGG
jgi:hypothetical protein